MILSTLTIGIISGHIEDSAFDGNKNGFVGVCT
jgi:hypothetical protein